MHFHLHNWITDCGSATRTSITTIVVVPMDFLGGRRTMRLTLEDAALLTKRKVATLKLSLLMWAITLSGDAYNNNQEFQQVSSKGLNTIVSEFQMTGNTKGLKCKEGVLDGQIRLSCLCPQDDCNDHLGEETMGDNINFSNFNLIWICAAILVSLFLLTCFVCSIHQINNTRWHLSANQVFLRKIPCSVYVKWFSSKTTTKWLISNKRKNTF